VIVVGAGAAGGLAAVLLAEAGLRVLVLDAGWGHEGSPLQTLTNDMVRKLADPENLRFIPPRFALLAKAALRGFGLVRQPVQSRLTAAWGREPEAFVDDRKCPYVTAPNRPFVWIRARQIGGRMVVSAHGWQYYRLSPSDLAPGDRSRLGWPLELGELDSWYSLVERRLGLSGARDGIAWQPDSELGAVLTPTANESSLMRSIRSRWPASRPMLGRFAPPMDGLEGAARTGRLRCRQGAIVKRIEVDPSGHVSGVSWFDLQTRSDMRVSAPIVFLCASALESTRLLLLSKTTNSPDGLGGGSGALGRHLMDHMIVSGWGSAPPLPASHILEERRSIYLPRFDARADPKPGPGPGFGVQLYQYPGTPTQSHFIAATFGEMLPRPENRVVLHPKRRDAWGIPVLFIDCAYDDADLARARLQIEGIRELAGAAGATLTGINSRPTVPGVCVHECGTARMGRDPRDSVLDPHNQCWEAKGLYVTDGASFVTQGTQNPTLTILALTARACHHAVAAVARTPQVPEPQHAQ
jgi:choline dehydrogenase-like flavoprotein